MAKNTIENKMKQSKCAKCGELATELHHLFSQSKLNKKLYGELIHHPLNIQKLCYQCHHNMPVDKLSELEFCDKLNIVPRSKCGLLIYNRNNAL